MLGVCMAVVGVHCVVFGIIAPHLPCQAHRCAEGIVGGVEIVRRCGVEVGTLVLGAVGVCGREGLGGGHLLLVVAGVGEWGALAGFVV